MIVRRFSVAVLAATLAVGACKGDPPPPPAPPAADQDSLRAYNDSVAAAAAERRRIAAEEAAERAAAADLARAVTAARATLEEAVFFDYDVSDVRADQQVLLRQKVDILRASPQVRLRIEGHADERGSTEYNMALGNRRASAVRDYLTGFGLPESRFAIVSLGEQRPRSMGSNEAAWAQNRRGEFVLTAGANQINPGN
jgi:peptidoglycan-associated lipoprotein